MTQPRIIFVDDRTDLVSQTVTNVNRLGAVAGAYAPDELEEDVLLDADLVLLDLDLALWTPEEAPPLQQPRDGLGFASVVRSHFRARSRPGAVALLSDKLVELAGGLTPYISEHGIARLHSLEWAFPKARRTDLPLHLHQRIFDLAAAGRVAADTWDRDEVQPRESLERFLSLPNDAPWLPHARVELYTAQPPIYELAAASGGLSVLRWLSQRVLPYPTFLIDDSYAAVMLGVDPSSFTDAVNAGGHLEERLAQVRYCGPLSAFLGRRWWSSGIQYLLTDIANGRPVPDAGSFDRLQDLASGELTAIEAGAVMCVNPDLAPLESPAPRHEVVRVRPDDWPIFARPAYAPISSFDDPELDPRVQRFRALVDPADLTLLPSG